MVFLGMIKEDFNKRYEEICRGQSSNSYSQQSHPRFRVTVLILCLQEQEFFFRLSDAFPILYTTLFLFLTVGMLGDWQYRLRLRDQMQYCTDHPEEVSKLSKVKAQVEQVKSIMMENIDKARSAIVWTISCLLDV